MTQNKEPLRYEHTEMDNEPGHDKEMLGESEPLRLGRRESEPHSAEVSYLFDVLSSNFPNHRTVWDLHHYFTLVGGKVDVQFDISLFMDLTIPEDIPSYDAADYNQKVPDLVINVLSKSTWQKDLSKIQEICRKLSIPIYIVFLAYPIVPTIFSIPFLRVYVLEKDGRYISYDLSSFMYDLDELVDPAAKFELPDNFPFDVALQKLSRTYLGRKTRSRLVLLKKGSNNLYLTKLDEAELKIKELEQKLENKK